jgi:hypothetical protein
MVHDFWIMNFNTCFLSFLNSMISFFKKIKGSNSLAFKERLANLLLHHLCQLLVCPCTCKFVLINTFLLSLFYIILLEANLDYQ